MSDQTPDPRVTVDRTNPPAPHRCLVPAAPIRRAAREDGAMDNQLLFGDGFDVYEINGGWAWGQAQADRYVGHVRVDHLTPGEATATHRVTALRAYAFEEADLKSPPLTLLSMNAHVCAQKQAGRFLYAHGAGWIFEGHLATLDTPCAGDHAATAERFLGAPYLWGGKESLGLDCSGLVQMALRACGMVDCPRDTDQQEAALGAPVPFDETLFGLQRGDLVFWKGHVGVMLDSARLIHANAHHMEVAIEPLHEARNRIAETGAQISSIKRL